MRILISNDDGIDAPGIRALAEAVSHLGEVTVVAPDRQRSASSHGITIHGQLYTKQVDLGIPNVTAYSISGTPVDCVKWALYAFRDQPPFDMLLSGINEGANLATDVLYSGTLAVAAEGALRGIQSIAFSLVGPPFPFHEAAQICTRVVTSFREITLPSDTFVSVNFPSIASLKTAPWRVTQLGARGYEDRFIERTDEDGNAYFTYAGEALTELEEDNTDTVAIEQGAISFTPLRFRFTNFEMIDTLNLALSNTTTYRR